MSSKRRLLAESIVNAVLNNLKDRQGFQVFDSMDRRDRLDMEDNLYADVESILEDEDT